jgi:hypothetical protein
MGRIDPEHAMMAIYGVRANHGGASTYALVEARSASKAFQTLYCSRPRWLINLQHSLFVFFVATSFDERTDSHKKARKASRDCGEITLA